MGGIVVVVVLPSSLLFTLLAGVQTVTSEDYAIVEAAKFFFKLV
jgi:hypothetical protein